METPIERAAFSDRMAYVCAELSNLAYFPWNGDASQDELTETIIRFVKNEKLAKTISATIHSKIASNKVAPAAALQAFKDILEDKDFTLVGQPFESNGTEAFICTREYKTPSGQDKTVAFLSFRGTQLTSYKDIKSDLDAGSETIDHKGEKLRFHRGFLAYYGQVREQVEQTLKGLDYDQLFITGHSLGGAAAVIATRLIEGEINGACYTFGAPPVGDKSLQYGLKTPIYQIVNDMDVVPNLPSPWLAWFFILIIWLIRFAGTILAPVRWVTGGNWDERAENFLRDISDYQHQGYVSYLIGSRQKARLRINVPFFRKLQYAIGKLYQTTPLRFGKKLVADHSIKVYVEKLRYHGEGRN